MDENKKNNGVTEDDVAGGLDLFKKIKVYQSYIGIILIPIFFGGLALFSWKLYLSNGFPLFLPIIFIIIGIGLELLSIIGLRRMLSVNMSQSAYQNKTMAKKIVIAKDETVQTTFSGILHSGNVSTSVLGKGKVLKPWNSLILTNYQLIIITVPVPAADQYINGVDLASSAENLLPQGIEMIDEKLQKMLKSQTLEEVANCHALNYAIPLSSITEIKLRDFPTNIAIMNNDKELASFSLTSAERKRFAGFFPTK